MLKKKKKIFKFQEKIVTLVQEKIVIPKNNKKKPKIP